jgi:hypothetical protein
VNPLRRLLQLTVPGGLAAGATCINHADPLRGGPTGGVIDLSGVPAGATVVQALLYWSVLARASPVPTGAPTFDGVALAPVAVGEVERTPCFGNQSHTGIFRADVTSLVTGDGSHVLAGFLGTGTQEGDLTEGATLLVVWCAADAPETDVVVWEGVDVTTEATPLFSQVLDGFAATDVAPVAATLVVVAGNGQGREPIEDDVDPVTFEGVDLDARDRSLLSGALCPPEGLYDLTRVDVTGLLAPGSTSASLETRSAGDCHDVGAVALAVGTVAGRSLREPSARDLTPGATPLRVAPAGGALRVSWEDVGAARYDLYRGDIGAWYSHGDAGTCGLDVAEALVTPEPGDHYFIAVSVGCGGASSSYGRSSLGEARPTALAASGGPCP